jgi:phenylacetic acid degradation operon negative regulatory protein
MTVDKTIKNLLKNQELRAAAFIVTVYGDIVLPRGGVFWTGSLIEICNRAGLSESVVRTAVSRLVTANRLKGERNGRRSYYSLDASSRAEFAQAAKLLYQPDIEPKGWQIIFAPELSDLESSRLRMGRMGSSVFIRPDRGQSLPDNAQILEAQDPNDMSWIAQFWDLSQIHQRYTDLIARFDPLYQQVGALSEETALIARLILVHIYRGVLLRDPRLPLHALPHDWQGHKARNLFRELYLALTPKAEICISNLCEGVDGILPTTTEETQLRHQGLLIEE